MTPVYPFFKKIIVFLLTLEARLVLRVYKSHIIAITGSVGKTSTKDAIYSVVSKHAFVRKSEKSFNSEIGIPLTILGVPNGWNNPVRWLENLLDGLLLIIWRRQYPEWLVLEVGADRPGDIVQIAKWLPVDIVVLTRIPDVPVHVEFFDSPEDVVREKAALLLALRPEGKMVANADDARSMELRERVPGQNITYGFALGSDVHATSIRLLSADGGLPVGISASVEIEGSTEKTEVAVLGTIGSHALSPILAGIAVGRLLGFDLRSMTEALAGHSAPAGRMRLLPGIKETLIVDDTYNASPVATLAALDALSLVGNSNRLIAVLGDMLELGRYSVEMHRKVGERAAALCDLLITVGFRARDIADGALNASMADRNIMQFEDAQKAGKYLESILEKGDVVLIKGSQSIRMERTVEEVMAEPERASELLVRQEREWKKR